MTDSRLSSLAMLSIENDCARSLDCDNVITAFANKKVRSRLFKSGVSNSWASGGQFAYMSNGAEGHIAYVSNRAEGCMWFWIRESPSLWATTSEI